MNATATSGFVIQSKVFGLQGEIARWAQMKSCESEWDVTRYLMESILPLGQYDSYRIEMTDRRGDGEKTRRYLSVEDWFESRQMPNLQMEGLKE